MGNFDLSGYKPESPESSDFGAFKYQGPCLVSSARIEEYTGNFDDYKGCEFFNIELVVLEGENEGRKLWGKYNLDAKDSVDKNGKAKKSPVKKLADQLFTLGLEFTDRDGLQKVAEDLVDMTVEVKAWYFKGSKGDNVQQHVIKGKANQKWDDEENSKEF